MYIIVGESPRSKSNADRCCDMVRSLYTIVRKPFWRFESDGRPRGELGANDDFVPPQLTREKTLFSVIDPCVGALRRKKKLPATPKTFIVAVETAQSEPEIQLAASTARLPLLHKRLPKSARARIAGRGGTRSASANSVRDVRPRNEAHKWSSKSQTAESASDPPGHPKLDAKRRAATTARPSLACRRSTRTTGAAATVAR